MSTAAKSKAPAKHRRALPAWGLSMWRVTIDAHDVPPRWHVPARTVELGAFTADGARESVARWAHVDAGVPPLRSLPRLTLAHTRVEPLPAASGREARSDRPSEDALWPV